MKFRVQDILSGLCLLVFCQRVHGLELTSVWQKSLQNHPTVQMHAAAQRSSALDIDTARQQLWPTPSVSLERVSSGAQDTSYGSSATLRTLRLQQPIWTGGRLTAGIEKAQAAMEATKAAAEDAKLQLVLKGLQYWSEWWSADVKLKAAQLSLKTHEALLDQVRRRVDQGVSAPVDLELTKGRLAQASSLFQSLRTQDRAARLKLTQLMGETISDDAAPQPKDSPIKLDADMAVIEQSVLDLSQLLKKMQAQLKVQQAEAKEISAELKPEVYLRVERTHSDSALSGAGMTTPTRVFVGVNSRFGAGLSSLSRVQSVTERLQAVEFQLQEARINLREQFASDWSTYQSAQLRLPLLEEAFRSADQSFDSANRQFLAGRKSWLEVMNSAREVQQAAFDLADVSVMKLQYHWRLVLMTRSIDELAVVSMPN